MSVDTLFGKYGVEFWLQVQYWGPVTSKGLVVFFCNYALVQNTIHAYGLLKVTFGKYMA